MKRVFLHKTCAIHWSFENKKGSLRGRVLVPCANTDNGPKGGWWPASCRHPWTSNSDSKKSDTTTQCVHPVKLFIFFRRSGRRLGAVCRVQESLRHRVTKESVCSAPEFISTASKEQSGEPSYKRKIISAVQRSSYIGAGEQCSLISSGGVVSTLESSPFSV